MTYNQGITQIKDIAKRQDIPEKFLEQIITLLKGANYIKTMRGPKGGVFLAKPPSKITLGEIIRLADGPTSPIACVSCSAYSRCTFENKCAFKGVWEQVRDKVSEIVDETTFQDMVERTKEMQPGEVIDYMI